MPEPSVQPDQADLSRGNFYEETDQELDISGNTSTIQLNNPSEETIFASNKIKEQYETMNLQNKEVMLRNT